ncbi:ABC transporter permease [Shewanella fidelis]|uniref:ABC transporter permease n=1 Tax=Shewanella fidelis TaxID=173509 RepID=A0AAW8NK52_9GAMM|nr:ABC transporter permease [Shewanella fidelis]MDR8522174.1 ABC transporter permease [Shewanella fidelis]MDW4812611.1 ABC transporter permease [Shewanella fidelis]MDW4816359.1 ABC transporter permease [Shewanella fidelis]MDW4820852.1 ABC transporter permease [Shewanella fidelis]MDW4825075.1 ABC transporter permease [Shewanella fidelis]
MIKALKREFTALQDDPWQLALVSYIPLISIIALWLLFSAGLPRQLPVAVVDLDNSQTSRALARQLQANPVTKPISYTGLPSAEAAMKQGEVYALLVLPYGLKRDLLTSKTPIIDIRYNSQFLLVGKLLSSQLQASMADGLKPLGELKLLAAGVPMERVAVNLSPVSSQTTALFNRNNNYVGFLVPPVLIALLQLVAMMVFANSLNRELRWNTTKQWYQLGVYKVIAAKVVFYTPLVLLHGGFILALIYLYLGLPIAGSIAVLLIAQTLMLLAVWLVVLTIFFVLKDSARVISFCTAMFAPAFAFMGVTFPTHEMPQLAQWWRVIMPTSHYIETHIAVVSYGQSLIASLPQMLSYWGFLLLLIPIGIFAKKGFAESELAAKSEAANSMALKEQ